MKCKDCGGTGWVTSSRTMTNGQPYRTRKCRKCGKTWTTVEIRKSDLERILQDTLALAREMRDQFKGVV